MNILQIHASVRGDASQSSRLAGMIVDRLRARYANAQTVFRDLAVTPPAVLDGFAVGALFTPEADRNPEQQARVAQDDALIAEIQAADVVVLGVPMYNFSVPVQLKSWLDAIGRAGVTFRYTEQGPEGLLKGKTVYLALARGGIYRDTPMDSQIPFLKTVLGFLGMNEVHCVYAEGLNMGPEAAERGFAQAQAELQVLLP